MAKLQSCFSLAVVVAASFSLTGCNVRSEPVITSTSGVLVPSSDISFALEENAPAMRSAFHSALVAEFSTDRQIAPSDAALIGDYSISSSPADVPLYSSEAGTAETPPVAVVTVREPSWTDSCPAVRTRATLAIYRVDDGSLVNRSIAEAIVCEGETPPYAGLAGALADAVTSS